MQVQPGRHVAVRAAELRARARALAQRTQQQSAAAAAVRVRRLERMNWRLQTPGKTGRARLHLLYGAFRDLRGGRGGVSSADRQPESRTHPWTYSPQAALPLLPRDQRPSRQQSHREHEGRERLLPALGVPAIASATSRIRIRPQLLRASRALPRPDALMHLRLSSSNQRAGICRLPSCTTSLPRRSFHFSLRRHRFPTPPCRRASVDIARKVSRRDRGYF